MSFRRTVQCFAITGLVTLAVPQTTALADNGVGGNARATHCVSPPQVGPTKGLLENQHGLDSGNTGHGFDRSYLWLRWLWRFFWHWHGNHCAVDPPAQVPEAPQVLMLSTSAVVTGGAAVFIIRRRARRPARVSA